MWPLVLKLYFPQKHSENQTKLTVLDLLPSALLSFAATVCAFAMETARLFIFTALLQ